MLSLSSFGADRDLRCFPIIYRWVMAEALDELFVSPQQMTKKGEMSTALTSLRSRNKDGSKDSSSALLFQTAWILAVLLCST
jgi:hypothetical protein